MTDHHNGKPSIHPAMQMVHETMMQGLGQLADYFGYNRAMGELYATLLLNPEPMSLDDLKAQIRKSKASVSMNTRTLEYVGAVKEVWVREDNPSNRKFYEAESDFWKIIAKLLGGRELRDIDLALAVIQDNITLLESARPEMDAENSELAKFYVERMQMIHNFFKFAKLLLTTILEKGSDLDIGEVSRVEIE
jgi:DNA-binding transcriptional regulator GbsR (MarR family)